MPVLVHMRIVTYNIHGGVGTDGHRTIERIAEVLRGIAADVVCLQEVHQHMPQSLFADQPRGLGRLLGGRVLFHAVSRFGIGRFGNAIITSLPVRSIGRHRLNNDRERERFAMRWERRGLLEVVLDAPSGPLRIMTTHWSLNATDRMTAASTVAEMMSGREVPAVLCGDLNATSDGPEIRRLAEEGGLIDAAARRPEPTFPANGPTARIDYVWHSPALGKPDVRVIQTQASDHLPLVAEWPLSESG